MNHIVNVRRQRKLLTPLGSLLVQVNVCVTTFKIVLRELGMTNWPFRQIQSVKRIALFVQSNPELFEVMT